MLGYHAYWKIVILSTFKNNPSAKLTLGEWSCVLGIQSEDILTSLSLMGFLNNWDNNILWQAFFNLA
jgi:hypothetical protein